MYYTYRQSSLRGMNYLNLPVAGYQTDSLISAYNLTFENMPSILCVRKAEYTANGGTLALGYRV